MNRIKFNLKNTLKPILVIVHSKAILNHIVQTTSYVKNHFCGIVSKHKSIPHNSLLFKLNSIKLNSIKINYFHRPTKHMRTYSSSHLSLWDDFIIII